MSLSLWLAANSYPADSAPADTAPPAHPHTNVTCDVCGVKAWTGARYHCNSCYDYECVSLPVCDTGA